MKIYTTQTLHGREYIYRHGSILYLDQLEPLLCGISESGMIPTDCSYKYTQFLEDEGVVDAVTARKVIDKLFARDCVRVRNPYVKFSEIFLDIVFWVFKPCMLVEKVIEHLVSNIMRHDL